MFIVNECFHKKREYLLLAGAYAIIATAKKEVVSKRYTKQKPQRSQLWGFL